MIPRPRPAPRRKRLSVISPRFLASAGLRWAISGAVWLMGAAGAVWLTFVSEWSTLVATYGLARLLGILGVFVFAVFVVALLWWRRFWRY